MEFDIGTRFPFWCGRTFRTGLSGSRRTLRWRGGQLHAGLGPRGTAGVWPMTLVGLLGLGILLFINLRYQELTRLKEGSRSPCFMRCWCRRDPFGKGRFPLLGYVRLLKARYTTRLDVGSQSGSVEPTDYRNR
jgi:hypothetical protein